MPNIKSAKKRVITDAKKKVQNKDNISSMRTSIKKANSAIKDGNKDNITKDVASAVKKIDKTLSSGLIHKNKAARLKSKLMKKANETK